MADNSSTFSNSITYCYCKSCIIAEAKNFESRRLFNDAFQVLYNAEQYYSQIAKELEEQKKALYSRADENDRVRFDTIQSSGNLCENKKGSTLIRFHPPQCGKQKTYQRIAISNTNTEFFCPVAVFETKSNPMQKSMYPKHLVYKDGQDIQLEEIRAAMYWEQMEKHGMKISKQIRPEAKKPERNTILATPLHESKNFNIERIGSPSNKEIRKPLEAKLETNPAASLQQCGNIDTLLSIADLKHPDIESDIVEENPRCKSGSSSADESVRKLLKESLIDSSQQPRTAVESSNTINQNKYTEEISHINFPRINELCRDHSTDYEQSKENYKIPSRTNQKIALPIHSCSSAINKEIAVEGKNSSINMPVKVNTPIKFDPNNLKKFNSSIPKTDQKFTDTTNVCNSVQKANLQETYHIEDKQVVNFMKSGDLNVDVSKIPKKSNYLDDISKLFEECCRTTEQDVIKVQPQNNENDENDLPIHMKSYPFDEDEEDSSCNSKAFAVILPSSTPNKRRSLFYSNGLFAEIKSNIGPRPSTAGATTLNLSMIPETSRERSSSSCGTGSVTSAVNPKNIQERPSLRVITETEEKLASLQSPRDTYNPFNPELLDALLERLQFPCDRHRNGYHLAKSDIPPIKLSHSYKLGSNKYTIVAEIGKGSYARILKAYSNCRPTEQVALKIQKPASVWEYYIDKEIMNRLKSDERRQFFLHYSDIFVFQNCSILLSEWAPFGSLLNFRNTLKIAKYGSEKYPMAVGVYISIQIVSAIDYLHSCRIIHGDVKPDNFIISSISNDGKPSIKLIDFGRSIDMTLFPKNTVFYEVVKTENFTCNEMRDGKPWTYQTDLYGIAGTMYVLIAGEYMKTIKKNDGLWILKKPLARYMYRSQWDPMFTVLLNVPSCHELPDLSLLKKHLETFYDSFSSIEKKQQFSRISLIFKK